jgi:indoleamine 2,3-dioxygenase
MSATTTTSSPVNSSALPAKHLLTLPRPDSIRGNVDGVVDTTTLAAHDFDIDNRTGFMPPKAPISRLPLFWSIWEYILEDAQKQELKLGETPGLQEHERIKSEKWRNRINNVGAPSFSLTGPRLTKTITDATLVYE